jgi:hypothetical protein
MAEHYSRHADRRHLAKAAIRKLEAGDGKKPFKRAGN